MRRRQDKCLWFTAVLVVLSVLLRTPADAAVPQLIHHQGRLTTSAGAPLPGSHNFTFKFYAAPSGGAALWTENQNGIVADTEGLYAVLLGSVTGFTSQGLIFDTGYYLGIEVDAGGEMTPRQLLAMAPFAYRAAVADSLASGLTVNRLTLTETMSAGKYTGDGSLLSGVTAAAVNVGNIIGPVNLADSTTGLLPGDSVASSRSQLTVDGTTLVVDATNNRVGIDSGTPGATLAVNGDVRISGTLVANGGLAIDSPTMYFDTKTNTVYFGLKNSFMDNDTAAVEINGWLRLTNPAWFNDAATSAYDGIVLWAVDTGFGAELKCRDENGNKTTLSPHNFSLAPRSEPMAWSYNSEKQPEGLHINVDLLRVVRLVERLTGIKLVYLASTNGREVIDTEALDRYLESGARPVTEEVERLEAENADLRETLQDLLRRIKALEDR